MNQDEKRLSDFKALTFDVYGTLIDWETGILNGLKPLLDRLDRRPSRNEILEAHAKLESSHQRFTPAKRYSDLLPVVYRRLAETWGLSVFQEECLEYGRSIEHWPAFPDSAEALVYLKQHYKLFVLSNVDHESFAHSCKKLGVPFDGVYTAEDIGSYKPDTRNFSYMLEMLEAHGIEAQDVLHTAESMFHDHAPANQMGLAGCHIFRRYQQEGFGATMRPAEMPHYRFRFHSMQEMADAHRAETAPR